MILLLKDDESSFLNVLSLLHIFQRSRTLKLILQKSEAMGINLKPYKVSHFVLLAGCEMLELLMQYFKVPLIRNPQAKSFWYSMIKKVSKEAGGRKNHFSPLEDASLLSSLASPVSPYIPCPYLRFQEQ